MPVSAAHHFLFLGAARYAVDFYPTASGVYSVDVLFNQLHVYGSPYTTLVKPGAAHPPHSRVLCDDGAPCATTRGVAGELQHFQARRVPAPTLSAAHHHCRSRHILAAAHRRPSLPRQLRARDVHKNDCKRGGAAVAAVLQPTRAAKGVTLAAEASASHPVEVRC